MPNNRNLSKFGTHKYPPTHTLSMQLKQFWHLQIEKSIKHKAIRCRSLAMSKNPDYLNKFANEVKQCDHGKCSPDCIRRLKEESEKRYKLYTPSNSITPIRMNRQK